MEKENIKKKFAFAKASNKNSKTPNIFLIKIAIFYLLSFSLGELYTTKKDMLFKDSNESVEASKVYWYKFSHAPFMIYTVPKENGKKKLIDAFLLMPHLSPFYLIENSPGTCNDSQIQGNPPPIGGGPGRCFGITGIHITLTVDENQDDPTNNSNVEKFKYHSSLTDSYLTIEKWVFSELEEQINTYLEQGNVTSTIFLSISSALISRQFWVNYQPIRDFLIVWDNYDRLTNDAEFTFKNLNFWSGSSLGSGNIGGDLEITNNWEEPDINATDKRGYKWVTSSLFYRKGDSVEPECKWIRLFAKLAFCDINSDVYNIRLCRRFSLALENDWPCETNSAYPCVKMIAESLLPLFGGIRNL